MVTKTNPTPHNEMLFKNIKEFTNIENIEEEAKSIYNVIMTNFIQRIMTNLQQFGK